MCCLIWWLVEKSNVKTEYNIRKNCTAPLKTKGYLPGGTGMTAVVAVAVVEVVVAAGHMGLEEGILAARWVLVVLAFHGMESSSVGGHDRAAAARCASVRAGPAVPRFSP